MSVNEKGNLRPDGISLDIPLSPWFGLGGTYYWNPGAPTAPRITLTGGLGAGGGGLHLIHLRKGMSSEDTLRFGASVNVPSFSVNASIPDESGIPLPWKAKVSSIGVGAGLPGVNANYTVTPEQIAAFIRKYVLTPFMGSEDQSSPPARVAQSAPVRSEFGAERPMPHAGPWPGTIGGGHEPPARIVSGSRFERAFSEGTAPIPYIGDGWAAPGGPSDMTAAVMRGGSAAGGKMGPAGGLLGMIQDYLQTDAARSDSR